MFKLYQHRARKRFGRSFLHDAGVIHHILRVIHAHKGQHLLEIDPGQDALTEGLLGGDAHLDVIKLDQDLTPLLKLKFGLESRFSLHQGDILRFDFASSVESGEKLRVVDNLSYNISIPLIFRLLEHVSMIEDMYSMLQKEMVERLVVTPGGGNWSRPSIMVQYHCRVEHLFNVSPGVFNPPPKVDSAIVRLTPFTGPSHPVCGLKLPERMAREVFNQRHKTLRNTPKSLLSVEDTKAVKIGPTLRPEQLDLTMFVCLANRLVELPGNR